jgi:hypothetical protein
MLATVRRALTIRLMCLEQAVEVQQEMMRETFQLVIKRPDNVCNFLEGGRLVGGKDVKVIYRHYATLYFVFVVDSSESELGILDLIQVSYRAAARPASLGLQSRWRCIHPHPTAGLCGDAGPVLRERVRARHHL